MDLGGDLNTGRSVNDSDRKFLIDFIFTTYLGPDVKSCNPICSFSQRLMAGFPPYTLSDLGSSYVSIAFLEKLYYYILRLSSPHLILDLNMFHKYLKGKLCLSSDFTQDSKQFTSFFPLDLHGQTWNSYLRIVKGIVFIDDPPMSSIKEEDLNRFKSLTGVSTLKFNNAESLPFGHQSSNEGDGNCVEKGQEDIQNEEGQSGQFQEERKRKYVDDTLPMPEFHPILPTKHNVKVDHLKDTCKSDGPIVMPLLSVNDLGVWNHQDCSLVLAGTAIKGLFGPSVGIVDIGISKGAYLFRASLAGVKKYTSPLSCKVGSNGRVQIKGTVNGGRTVSKHARVFQMKIRKLCPPGPFTLSFNLPGPVDPRLFVGDFRADGIFEGIVMKL